MGSSIAGLALLLAALAVMGATAQDDTTTTLPPLPLFPALPGPCGRVDQVQLGDSCSSIAARAGITLDKFGVLNPLLLCNDVPLQPGSAVCSGDAIAFCNNVVVAAPGDTCATIANAAGTVINVDGTNTTTCKTLSSGVPVCVSPAPGKCAVATLCGISIPPKLQDALLLLTDYCSIIAECQSPFAVTNDAGKDVLTLNVDAVTPAVLAVKDKDGHPELAQFAAKPAGSVLGVTITADWFEDGSGVVVIGDSSAPARRLNRKLKANVWRPTTYRPRGMMQYPKLRYY